MSAREKAERERGTAFTSRDNAEQENDRLRTERDEAREALARVEALAEAWRYKGEFGWGSWQEGDGPDQEGYVLDTAAALIRDALRGE